MKWQLKVKFANHVGVYFMEQQKLSTVDLNAGIKHLESGRSVKRCTYCNSPDAIVRDHVVSAAWLGRRSYRDKTVPSCNDCNSILSDAPLFNVEERAEYVLDRILKSSKYKNILSTPHWSEDELLEVDYKIQSMVKAGMKLKKELEVRIENLHKLSGVEIISEINEVDDKTAKRIIFDYAFSRGLPHKVIENLSYQYSLKQDDIKKAIRSNEYQHHWIALKVLNKIDILVSDHKARSMILKREDKRIMSS